MAFLADPIFNRIATSIIQFGMLALAIWGFKALKDYE